ncbi:hypothetical protein NDN08_003432 [Rhodosorus marinus]|uniref:Anaphase-promoting complex subunit 4 WD40 domain-containing protein n=1 Tax=Rhodosorus marinus TaxID=101924 RepID=A0AAV8UWL0_9RHOD|nr:hypothetical protein NDN08_003432 [Rhodosorus marinus]
MAAVFGWDSYSMSPRDPPVSVQLVEERIGTSVAFDDGDGRLFVGDSVGHISTELDPNSEGSESWTHVKAHNSALHSLCHLRGRLWSGSSDDIKIWSFLESEGQFNPTGSVTFKETEIPNKRQISALNTNCLAVHVKSDKVLSASESGVLCSWDAETGSLSSSFNEPDEVAICSTTYFDANSAFTGSDSGMIRLWDLRERKHVKVFEPWRNAKMPRAQWISGVAVDESEIFLASTDGNKSLVVFHVGSGTVLGTSQLKETPRTVSFLGEKILVGTSDSKGSIPAFNLEAKAAKPKFESTLRSVYGLAVRRTQQMIMAATGDAKVRGKNRPIIDVYNGSTRPSVSMACAAN